MKPVFVVAKTPGLAKYLASKGDFYQTFEEALNARNSGPINQHNLLGIFMVSRTNDDVRLAATQ